MGAFSRLFSAAMIPGRDPNRNAIWTGTNNVGVYANYGTASREVVNERTAMGVSAFFAGVRNISEDVAKLPIRIIERRGKERIEHREHIAWRLLNDSPDGEMDAMTFRETMTQHAIAFEKGVAWIERTNGGDPLSLQLLDPTRVTKKRTSSGALYYEYRSDSGRPIAIPHADVLEVHGIGYDGMSGYRIVELAKEMLGLTLGAQKFSGSFFGNGTWLGGVVEFPKGITDKALATFRESFERRHRGAGNANLVGIIQDGGEYKQLGVEPQKAQMVESMQFGIEEVSRWLRIPPHKLQHLLRSTYNNIEHQSLEYLQDCLLSWLIRWETNIRWKLLGLDSALQAKHSVDSIVRADMKTRYEAYAVGRQWGWLSANDVLEREDENPIGPEGDMRLTPVNMADAKTLIEGGTTKEIDDPDSDGERDEAKEPPAKGDDKNAREKAAVVAMLPAISHAFERNWRQEEKSLRRISQKATSAEDFEAKATQFYAEQSERFVNDMRPLIFGLRVIAGLSAANVAQSDEVFLERQAERFRERATMVTEWYRAPDAHGTFWEEMSACDRHAFVTLKSYFRSHDTGAEAAA